MGKWYHYDFPTNKGMDIHPERAKLLGFELRHPGCEFNPFTLWTEEELAEAREARLSRGDQPYRPVSIQFVDGFLSSAQYRTCEVCGENHESLVIAFMDWYMTNCDLRIHDTETDPFIRVPIRHVTVPRTLPLAVGGIDNDPIDALLEEQGPTDYTLV